MKGGYSVTFPAERLLVPSLVVSPCTKYPDCTLCSRLERRGC